MTLCRRQWADYFDSQNILYAFFSAANATAIQQARRDALAAQEAALATNSEPDSDEEDEEDEDETTLEADSSATSPLESTVQSSLGDEELSDADESDETEEGGNFMYTAEDDAEDAKDPRTRVLSVLELEDLFLRAAPDLSGTYPLSTLFQMP